MASSQGVNHASSRSGPSPAGRIDFDALQECVEEGVRQLHLTILWYKYRAQFTALRDRHDDREAGVLANRLAEEAIRPFGDAEWLPGGLQTAETIKKQSARYRSTDWSRAIKNLEDQLLAYVHESARSGHPPRLRGLQEILHAFELEPERDAWPPVTQDNGDPFLYNAAHVPIFWSWQAEALDGWYRLTPALVERENAFDFDKRLRKEIERVALLVKGIERIDRSGLADEARRHIRNLEIVRVIAHPPPPGRASGVDWNDRYYWQVAYDQTPATWPPRALAELARSVREITGRDDMSWLKALKIPRPASPLTPREALALGVVDALDGVDRARPLPMGVWDEARRQLGHILGCAVVLIRHQELDAARAHWRTVRARGDSWSLRTTGLATTSPGVGDRLLRPAEFEAPAETESPLYDPLKALRGLKRPVRLAELARLLLSRLAEAPDLHLAPSTDDLALIWEILGRARIAPSPESSLLILELDRLGYRLASPPARSGAALAPGWTVVVADGVSGRPQTLAGPGVGVGVGETAASSDVIALQTPDGRFVFPSVWVRVPHPWIDSEPWVRILVHHESTLPRLIYAGPDESRPAPWAARSGLADLIADLIAARTATGPGLPPPPSSPGMDPMSDLFLAFYDEDARFQTPRDRNAGRLDLIARDFYQAMTEPARARLGVPLRAADLAVDLPALVKASTSETVRVTWDEAVGTSREVEVVNCRLARPGRPAAVHLRAAATCPAEVLRWATLPPLGALTDGPLATAFRALRWLPARPDAATALAEIEKRIKIALQDDSTVNALILPALADDPAAIPFRRWLRQIFPRKAITIYPDLDPETFAPRWAETSKGAAAIKAVGGLAWRFDDVAPIGVPIPSEELRFSLVPERARGTFSLGSRGDRPWLAAAIEACKAAQQVDGLPDPLAQAIAALAEEAPRFARSDPSGRPGEDWAPLVSVLSAIAEAPSTTSAAALDLALAGPREVARSLGLTVHPANWSYARPPDLGEFSESEARVDPDDPPPAFTEGAGEAGALTVRRFGLGASPALLGVSSGRAPEGYQDLVDHLGGLDHPDARKMLAMLLTWPLAARSGRLDLKAIDFYLAFWMTLGETFRGDSYDEFVRLEARVAALLERAFQFFKFEPRAVGDLPESWVEVVARGPLRTGRVRRLRRPGLKTSQGALRVAAQVEIE